MPRSARVHRWLAPEELEPRRLLAAVPTLQIAHGSIAGTVHSDHIVMDGRRQDGETLLAGIRVELLDDSANLVASALTASQGVYRFEGVWPGVYAIREAQSERTVFSDIEVHSGEELTGYDFGEPPLGSIAAAFNNTAEVQRSAPQGSFSFVPTTPPSFSRSVALQRPAQEEYFPNSVDGESQPWRFSLLKPTLDKASGKIMHSASLPSNPLRSGKWILDDAKGELAFGAEGAILLVGDFNGDGRDELGVYREGEWLLDINGNHRSDDDDTTIQLGTRSDQPVVGDWDGDGDDDIGVYAPQDATPLAGDFAGHGRDVIGLFENGTWQLDANGDGKLNASDPTFTFGAAGDTPVVGDFDGDGRDEIGVFRNGRWIIDSNHNGQIDAADKVFELGGAGDVPIVGDFDGDGTDEPGLYRSAPAARISRTR